MSCRFGGLWALDDVSVSVSAGEILGLIGPNGAGKTTLFNCLCGIVRPTSGEIRFRGERTGGQPPYRLVWQGICHTHQIPRPFGEMSVLDNVLVGGYFGRGGRGKAAQNAEQALLFTGLDRWANAPASQLTAGQRKLLEMARALATQPELLLLDEVCGGLNPAETAHVLDLIRTLPGRGITVIYVEHNMRAVMSVCDRIAVLNFGRKIADGAPNEVAANPDVVHAYLGAPESISETEQ